MDLKSRTREIKVAELVQSPSLNNISPASSSLCPEFSFDVVLGKTPRQQVFIINVKAVLKSVEQLNKEQADPSLLLCRAKAKSLGSDVILST